ncbi:MAG: cupin domain-containing protein [Succinivibrionaceae bacterium]|nr:cupin domain-containing protein [Succinivibrionaceae bacterium]
MFTFYKDTVPEPMGNGVTRRILVHEGAMMAVENTFETGGVGAMHSHPHEQVTYVQSGRFRFTIGDEVHEVVAGDTLHKNANVVHGCTCLEAGVLIDVFTPQREDFLKK